jgi:DNA processing protein
MSNLNSQELQYWIAFNQLLEFGPKRFSKLLSYFPSLEIAWQAANGELIKAGIEEKIITKLAEKKPSINPAQELAKVEKLDFKVITLKDDTYPAKLKEIANPPPLLYCRGEIFKSQDEFTLAVVGTRKITPYGEQITKDLVRELTQNGLTIVSGLALGIDALAHKTCLEAQGRTIAVLGNGLDSIYPASNLPLARRILDTGGLIVSEFPLGTPSFKSNFPHRNRIISGLALGTLVIEAATGSGSLITASIALDQNREIFAVPGPINSSASKGTNELIKQGAIPVSSAQDIIQALNLELAKDFSRVREILADNLGEEIIIKLLDNANLTIDELIKKSKLDAKEINSILVGMELKGKVRKIGGLTYSLAR